MTIRNSHKKQGKAYGIELVGRKAGMLGNGRKKKNERGRRMSEARSGQLGKTARP